MMAIVVVVLRFALKICGGCCITYRYCRLFGTYSAMQCIEGMEGSVHQSTLH